MRINYIIAALMMLFGLAACRTGNTDDNPPVTHPNTRTELTDGTWTAGQDGVARGNWTTKEAGEFCSFTQYEGRNMSRIRNAGRGEKGRVQTFTVFLNTDDIFQTSLCGTWRKS